MYISAKYINGEYYYYLVKSERVGGKVYQTIEKYLGKKGDAKKYAKKHKLKMPKTKPGKEKADIELDKRIEEKRERLEAIKPSISPSLQKKLEEDETILWTYNSTKIEGSSLTLFETSELLKHDISAAGKPLRDHTAVKDHKIAIDLARNLAEKKTPITEEEICDIHRAVLHKEAGIHVGHYREVPAYITNSKFVPPPPQQVRGMMKDLVGKINKNPEKPDPVALAAVTHHSFETIHPFEDGNGRTGRLISNLILMRNGFPPIIIENKERKRYFKMLDDICRTHAYEKIIYFFKKKMDRTLTFYLKYTDPKFEQWRKKKNL